MSKHVPPPASPKDVERVELKDALEERYLAYALSTIMNRALPDVRDGLKPVHRRLLYAMRQLRLDPNSAFKKSARVVGDVIGQYHPHGDQSIYDALVRLAQEFSVRYPLIEGQGNFGNIDGDAPAAYRYTEARMTDVARLLLDGIDEDAGRHYHGDPNHLLQYASDSDELEESGWWDFLQRRSVPLRDDAPETAQAWMRVSDSFGTDQVLNRCAVAYLSDDLPNDCVITALPEIKKASDEGRRFSASLDHAVWFHRPVQADEWNLFTMSCVNYAGGRGMTFGYVHSQDGRHLATVAQETLVSFRES